MGCQINRRRSLLQRKAVSDERTDVESAGKDEAGDFVLEREVGGVAADQIFFVQTD